MNGFRKFPKNVIASKEVLKIPENFTDAIVYLFSGASATSSAEQIESI